MKLDWSDPIVYKKGGKFDYPSKDGVYVITSEIPNRVAKYVGQGNIAERIEAHKNKSEQNAKLRNLMNERKNYAVYFALVPREKDRNNAERTLYDYFGADNLYNQVTPQGEFDATTNYPFLKDISFE